MSLWASQYMGWGGGVVQGEYLVTTAFIANEVITTSTGAGATAGVTTKTGDTVALGASSGAFNANTLLIILLNGIEQLKGTDVIYDSATTFHFVSILSVGDYFEIRLIA